MKTLLLSLAITATLAACATTTSPTGRRQYVGAVSQAELNQLGQQAFNELKQQKQQSSNAQQRAYVDCVVDTVVASMPADWRAATGATGGWENALFQDADANAFALPGGKVGVYTGIFDVARNQDQLAAVIAHEIGHVVAHHHDERITRQAGASGVVQLVGALPKREPSSAPTSCTTPEAPAWRVMRSSWWWATTWPISCAITAASWSWLRATSKIPV